MVETEGSGVVVRDGGGGRGAPLRTLRVGRRLLAPPRRRCALSPLVVPRDAFPEERLASFPIFGGRELERGSVGVRRLLPYSL